MIPACPATDDADSDAVLTQNDSQSPLDALAAMIAKLTPDDRAKLVGMLLETGDEGHGR